VSFVAPSAALVPSVAPHAAPMPSVAPRAALVPPTGPHATPVPPDAPFADPVPPAAPHAAPTPPTRYTELLQVYRHRTMPASAQDPPTLARRFPHAMRTLRASTPPTPPPRRSRVEPAVCHPPIIHRDPCHTHPMVTRHSDGDLRPETLSATEGES
jgi:hypothetical protein